MNRAATLLFVIASRCVRRRSRRPGPRCRQRLDPGRRQAGLPPACSRYMAEDLQYAHAGGQTQNRDEYIAAVTTGPAHYESFTFSDVKIKIYGKAAVLTGFVESRWGAGCLSSADAAGLHGKQRTVADVRASVDPPRAISSFPIQLPALRCRARTSFFDGP